MFTMNWERGSVSGYTNGGLGISIVYTISAWMVSYTLGMPVSSPVRKTGTEGSSSVSGWLWL